MQIPVLIEPMFRHSCWCRQTLSGMFAEAKRKKYTLRFLDNPSALEEVFSDAASPRMAIVVGTSVTFVPGMLRQLETLGIHALLINYDNFSLPSSHSVVRMDYVNAMQRLMGYFYHYGKKRIALIGFNPNSSADRIKEQFFCDALISQGESDPQRHIFRNRGSIRECFSRFLPHAGEYDALLCVNDIVAVAALGCLRQAGIDVPGQLLLAGFGESILSRKVCPSITTISLNHEELGKQAVTLFAYLHRQSTRISATVQVKSEMTIRESTDSMPDLPDVLLCPNVETAESVDFYKDQDVQSLLQIEDFCFGLDELDQEILARLPRDASLESIAEDCHTSVSTIGYRLRNMQSRLGVASRQELMARLFSVLSPLAFTNP